MSGYLPHNHAITEPSGRIGWKAENKALKLAYSGHLIPPTMIVDSTDAAQAAHSQFDGAWTQIWGRR